MARPTAPSLWLPGFDPAALTPAEVYAAKVVLALVILAVGVALTPLFSAAYAA